MAQNQHPAMILILAKTVKESASPVLVETFLERVIENLMAEIVTRILCDSELLQKREGMHPCRPNVVVLERETGRSNARQRLRPQNYAVLCTCQSTYPVALGLLLDQNDFSRDLSLTVFRFRSTLC